jgi:hypothetical protein
MVRHSRIEGRVEGMHIPGTHEKIMKKKEAVENSGSSSFRPILM